MPTIPRLLFASLCASLAAAEASGLELAIDRPGHIHAPGEPVVVRVRGPAGTLAWTLRDWRGDPAASGTAAMVGGSAELRPPAAQPGYFSLQVAVSDGEAVRATRTTSYAVVPPAPARDLRFGAMTHFAQGWDVDLLPLLARIGIGSVRDEHYWDEVEAEPGKHAFDARSTGWMAACAAAGIEPLVAMTFGNKHYDGGHAPVSDAGRAAYARYGEAILARFDGQVKALEVWNEYNGSWCGGEAEQDRPRYYAEMIKAAYPRLKARDPAVTVLGGAAVLLPPPWFEGIFAHGALAAMDAVVIHPYRGRPEGVEREVAVLQEQIRRHNGGRDKPIWVTETGAMPAPRAWPWEGAQDTHERARAATASYLVRQYALLLSTGTVARIYWYLARDYGEFRLMGLLRDTGDAAGRYAVAAPYVAYATLIRELAGLQPRGLVAVGRPVYLAAFAGGGRETRVCWATLPARLRLAAATPLTVVDLAGVERVVAPVDGQVELALGQEPLFVRGTCTAAALGAGPRVVAESASDFAREQGANGWTYGCSAGAAGPFTPMTVASTMWGETWRGQADFLAISAESAHPGSDDGQAVWAVRRWTSPLAGQLRLVGSCQRDAEGDGSGLRIRVDGQEVFAALIGGPGRPAELDFDRTVTVRAGSTVDFAITPGPGQDISNDSTAFSVAVVMDDSRR